LARLTDGASAAAGFRSEAKLDPKRYKDKNQQLEDARSGGRLHARVI